MAKKYLFSSVFLIISIISLILNIQLGITLSSGELDINSIDSHVKGSSHLNNPFSTLSNELPNASFVYNPLKPIVDEKTIYNASESFDPDGYIPTNSGYMWRFGDGETAYGEIVEHSYGITGNYNVTLTITDNEGAVANSTKIVNITNNWTFAIITDLHIGRGYPKYNGEEYYLTQRLTKAVNWIFDNREAGQNNIKFVMVLGDISENGKYNELIKAKEILDNGLKDLPYFPLIGNHDAHNNGRENFDSIFNDTFFNQQFDKLRFQTERVMDTSPFLNYVFQYGGSNFICLDFVQDDVKGVLHNETMNWLRFWTENATPSWENKPTILFSHHPMIGPLFFVFDIAFNASDIAQLENEVIGWDNVLINFAGHVHSYYDPVSLVSPLPMINANTLYIGPKNTPVVTTESLGVASNLLTPKGTIRLVDLNGSGIINYKTIEGQYLAVNPVFKTTTNSLYSLSSDPYWKDLLLGKKIRIDFDTYAFTKMFTEEFPLSYYLEFGDGASEIVLSNESKIVNFTHYYSLDAERKQKVTLRVTAHTLDGEPVVEQLTREISLPQRQSGFSFIAYNTIDITITDPDGLIINKQFNEIPGAIYDELDLDEDGTMDVVSVLPERKVGEYLLTVFPKSNAAPMDNYTIEASWDDKTITLADDAQISDIPDEPYLIKSSGSRPKINGAPIANAEIAVGVQSQPIEDPDDYYTIEQNTVGGANFILDARSSYDPEGKSLVYTWSGAITGTGDTLTTFLPIGEHEVLLNVSDGDLFSVDRLVIKVQATQQSTVTGRTTNQTSKTADSKKGFISLPFFTFFIVVVGILGYYQRKRKLI